VVHSVQRTFPIEKSFPALLPEFVTEQEDWSFANISRAQTRWGPHGYHRYPAKFIPQLVHRIIQRYSAPGAKVGDPFLGSATTGIETLRAGRYFYGSDIHPVALLISQAKCTPIAPQTLSQAWEILNAAITLMPHIERRPLTVKEIDVIQAINIARASADQRLLYWFPEAYRDILTLLLQAITTIAEESTRIFFLCAFSNILRSCSIWLSGSTKPQKDLKKILADPVEEFRKQVQSMIKRNLLYWNELQELHIPLEQIKERYSIISNDARHLTLPDGALDLLVTSPPYATCYEYSEMHQLTQLWFEKHAIFPSQSPSHSYIGSKNVRQRVPKQNKFSTGSVAADEALSQLQARGVGPSADRVNQEVRALRYYFQDMHEVIHEFARVVGSHKYFVLIIGDSCRRGISIPTSDALCEMAISEGFELEQKIVRSIPERVLVSTRDKKTGRFSSSAQSDTRVYPEENVLILKRQT
jgi:DNA modification methylase